jgi:predicted transcriptional regulator
MPASMPETTEELPLVAPTEWRVLYCLYLRGRASIKDIGLDLSSVGFPASSYSTLQTFVTRLIRKGYVRSEPNTASDTTYVYVPVVSYETALRREADRFFANYLFDDPRGVVVLQEALDELADRLAAEAAGR